MAGARILRLRRADVCSRCSTPIAVGVEASWDPSARKVTCLLCLEALPQPPAGTPPPPPTMAPRSAPTSGPAGGSARAEGERRRAEELERRRQRVERRPILGRLANLAAGEPTAGAEHLKGAVGEEKFGAALDALRPAGVHVLHDRRRLRTAANIDHIAIAASGVWVIDAKRWKGLVERVDKGTFFRADHRLLVGRRDRSSAAAGVQKQVADVREALRGIELDVPVHGVLCFIDAEWRLFPKPFEIDGVLVSWPKALLERITQPGPLHDAARDLIHERLATRLKPAG